MLVGEDKNKVRNILNENFSNHEQYRTRRYEQGKVWDLSNDYFCQFVEL
jgi:hypothetical protein